VSKHERILITTAGEAFRMITLPPKFGSFQDESSQFGKQSLDRLSVFCMDPLSTHYRRTLC